MGRLTPEVPVRRRPTPQWLRWAVFAVVLLAISAGVLVSSLRIYLEFSGSSRQATTQQALDRYVLRAVPRWLANHPHTCPPSVLALSPLIGNLDDRDLWGTGYRMLCGSERGVSVVIESAGEDQRFGTRDDLRSRHVAVHL